MPEPSTVLENRPFWKIARETGLSRATVARIGKAKGLSRLSNLDPKIEIVRDEKTLPGEMIHSDIKKRGRIEGVGHRIPASAPGKARRAAASKAARAGNICIWPSTITPGWPPLKSCSEILPDETRRSCLKFLFNALRFYRDPGVRVLRVMTGNTDNGVSFRSRRSTPLHAAPQRRCEC